MSGAQCWYAPVAFALAIGILACGGPPEDPAHLPVAILDEKTITVSDLERYLRGNLADVLEDGNLPARDLARIKSRLFDNFLDEEILLLEAERQEVIVEEQEINAYLGIEGPDAGEGAEMEPGRRMARRNLRIQKLRGAYVRAKARVTEEEIDAYVEAHREAILPEHHLVMRSFPLSSKKDARHVRGEILERGMSFDEAREVFGATPEQGQPAEVTLEGLPEAVRKAVENLEPGEISRPVEFQGSFYLFLVDAWRAKEEVSDAALRERAREELMLAKAALVSQDLLEELRERVRVRVYRKNLPFQYVQEEEAG